MDLEQLDKKLDKLIKLGKRHNKLLEDTFERSRRTSDYAMRVSTATANLLDQLYGRWDDNANMENTMVAKNYQKGR